jgi:hypothetical protein
VCIAEAAAVYIWTAYENKRRQTPHFLLFPSDHNILNQLALRLGSLYDGVGGSTYKLCRERERDSLASKERDDRHRCGAITTQVILAFHRAGKCQEENEHCIIKCHRIPSLFSLPRNRQLLYKKFILERSTPDLHQCNQRIFDTSSFWNSVSLSFTLATPPTGLPAYQWQWFWEGRTLWRCMLLMQFSCPQVLVRPAASTHYQSCWVSVLHSHR